MLDTCPRVVSTAAVFVPQDPDYMSCRIAKRALESVERATAKLVESSEA